MSTYIPTTLPTTIPLNKFRESLLGSWILWLESDTDISTKIFPPDNNHLKVVSAWNPDREEDFDVPSIVIHRLQENFKSGSVGGYMTKINTGTPSLDEEEHRIYSNRMIGMYQFDVITRDLFSQWTICSYLDKKFSGEGRNSLKGFKVLDFNQREGMGKDIPETDVRVLWKPWKDVSMVETAPTNTEFKQVSYTVAFWSDLWYASTEEVITNIKIIEKLYKID